jgi:hypothetical protein
MDGTETGVYPKIVRFCWGRISFPSHGIWGYILFRQIHAPHQIMRCLDYPHNAVRWHWNGGTPQSSISSRFSIIEYYKPTMFITHLWRPYVWWQLDPSDVQVQGGRGVKPSLGPPDWFCSWRFPKSWGYPNSWMVYFRENPIYKWMITGGTPIFRKLPYNWSICLILWKDMIPYNTVYSIYIYSI